MTASGLEVGRVSSVWRYPVKSMQGEELHACQVGDRGLLGDRAFALLDVETGRVASAKSPRVWPDLLQFAASFVEAPSPGAPLPPVRIRMPDGAVVRTDDPAVNDVLSSATGRRVELVTSNPKGARYEQYVPPVDDADPEGTNFYREFPNDVFGTGSLHDASPIHLVTTSTLEQLTRLYPEGRFDPRRFRPNLVVEVDGAEPGFEENTWVKKTVSLGASRIRITFPTLRCVMTTRAQGDLPQDLGILRTPARHNRLQVLSLGKFPCVGVNAVVEEGGPVRRGDSVVVHP